MRNSFISRSGRWGGGETVLLKIIKILHKRVFAAHIETTAISVVYSSMHFAISG